MEEWAEEDYHFSVLHFSFSFPSFKLASFSLFLCLFLVLFCLLPLPLPIEPSQDFNQAHKAGSYPSLPCLPLFLSYVCIGCVSAPLYKEDIIQCLQSPFQQHLFFLFPCFDQLDHGTQHTLFWSICSVDPCMGHGHDAYSNTQSVNVVGG